MSPKKEDEFAEYRDNDFLEMLGITGCQSKLFKFWPKGGPQWVALGKLKNEFHFIVEAKANIPEITSSCQATSENSKTKINNSVTHIPTSIEQWHGAIKLQKHLMALGRHRLQQYVLEIFINIEEIIIEQKH